MDLEIIDKKNTNYEPVKFYFEKNDKSSEPKFLEDSGINSFEKLEKFIEIKVNSIKIEKDFTFK